MVFTADDLLVKVVGLDGDQAGDAGDAGLSHILAQRQ